MKRIESVGEIGMKRLENLGVVLGVCGAILVSLPASQMIVCAANSCWVIANSILITKFVIDKENRMVFLFSVYLLCALFGVWNNVGWIL